MVARCPRLIPNGAWPFLRSPLVLRAPGPGAAGGRSPLPRRGPGLAGPLRLSRSAAAPGPGARKTRCSKKRPKTGQGYKKSHR